MSTLTSIVYVSTATPPMSESELEGLLIEARALNMVTHTTGVLLYSDGSFMQCFEAADADARITWNRIRASRRHTGIIELVNEQVAQRSFGDWQMGFARPPQSKLLALSSAQWQRHADTGEANSAGLRLLREFWMRERR